MTSRRRLIGQAILRASLRQEGWQDALKLRCSPRCECDGLGAMALYHLTNVEYREYAALTDRMVRLDHIWNRLKQREAHVAKPMLEAA